jgi:rubrerythrin
MNSPELEKIFSMAISREIEACEFYHALSERVIDKTVKKTFKELADEEMMHRDTLEKFKADPELSMKISPPSVDYKIAEATEFGILDICMKPPDAIALAMKKEQQAVEFYRSLASSSKDEEIKKVLENFANMELNHKHRLENVFVEIGYPEVF